MFSENNRISARQIKYLLILEGIARLCVLLPVCLSGKTMGSMIVCLILGTVIWALAAKLVLSWVQPGENFFDAVARSAGTELAVVGCFAGLLFFLVQASVFLNLCAELTSVYLLPEIPVPVLCLLPLTAGVYLSLGSVEVRGRFCEVAGPVVVGLLVLLTVLAGFGMEAYQYEPTTVRLQDDLAAGSFEVFACIGGMFLPVIGQHFSDEQGRYRKSVFRAGAVAAAIAGSLCAIAVGSYGKNGMSEIDFPIVRVMSNVKIPGGFLQRWDIIFLSLLLVCLAVTVAGALWYVREMLEKLWSLAENVYVRHKHESDAQHTGKPVAAGKWLLEKRVMLSWVFCIVLIYLSAGGFLSALTAVCYYRALNLQLLVPVMLFFYITVSFQRKRKQGSMAEKPRSTVFRKKRTAAYLARMLVLALLLLTSVLLLGGCTSYEPEERLFPMALEIGAENGELVIAYAWNEGAGPGAAQEESLTGFRGSSLTEIKKKTAAFTERYMDYSHVKAIIFDESLEAEPELEREVMEWLSGEPAFASGLIVYPSRESGLTLETVQQSAGGQTGVYLERLYKNNEEYRNAATTLGRVIAEYYA